MTHPRENRELRALDRLLTIGFYIGCVIAAALLIGLPVLRATGADGSFTIAIPAAIDDLDTRVRAEWNGQSGSYVLRDLRGDVEIPASAAPWSLLLVTWLAWAALCGLTLAMLYQARGLVRRVRGGAPFDVQNAVIVRRLGMLLLVHYLVNAFYVFGISNWLATKVARESVHLSSAPYANWSVLLAALVLMALAEIFRRGAALEHEQSLVV